MKITKPNSGVQIWRPTWNKTRTVFRVFPGLDEENPGNYTPFRNLENEEYTPKKHGDWIEHITATSIGTQDRQVTFITHDPLERGGDSRNNPVSLLIRAITDAVEKGTCNPAWNKLVLKNKESYYPPLNTVEDFYLVQGVLIEHRSKGFETVSGYKGVGTDDTVVLMMKRTAGEKLLEDLLMRRDAKDAFVYQDITDLTDGWFMGIAQNATQWPGDDQPELGADVATKKDFPHYDVRLMKSWSVNNVVAPLKIKKDLVDSKTKLWDDILYRPTIAEQIDMIIDAGIDHDALSYALKEFYDESDGLSDRALRILNPEKYARVAEALPKPPQAAPVANAVGIPKEEEPALGEVPEQHALAEVSDKPATSTEALGATDTVSDACADRVQSSIEALEEARTRRRQNSEQEA
jgi:hypothetical protein